ncbi:helix-turn-helix domain-containing protein [Hydrogenophaga sp.]|uniref:helix-turn-helix domain-containing protein n=1 Tax=Hydrogenophaga sp. TaxID=1904254 RepID=UPI002721130B|nr:helix-turn-helix domain-containing protein [Hydrogenophaga sp.]MDO8903987.1 helix-turn-helix domain-containing protein [Hydrogenophaga sp.]
MHKSIKWSEVVGLIQKSGRSQQQIASHVGVDQSTVCRLADGRAPEPRYSVGEKLLALLAEVQKTEAPQPTPVGATLAEQTTEHEVA